MAKSTGLFLVLLGLLATLSLMVRASDPDLTTDYDVTNPTVANFTFSGFRDPAAGPPGVAIPAFAAPLNFPGLSGLGLSAVLFEFGAQSQVDPHTHPRGTELLYVTLGPLDVGFVDTNNVLFETTVETGDLFVIPKGLLHWLRNNGSDTASGYAVVSGENPGTLFVTEALFIAGGTGLPDIVLSTAFNTTTQDIDSLKQSIAAKDG